MFGFFEKKKTHSLNEISYKLTREELIRRSRTLVIDDERPDLIDDLKSSHFAVDYVPDITNTNRDLIETAIYDLILLDYGNVGSCFGQDEGLSLLRHIKRINPSVYVLAYTSKSLTTSQADFFRLSNGVLAKDAGITESTEKIEEGLKIALSAENLWGGLLKVVNIAPGSKEDNEWQNLLVTGLKQGNLQALKNKIGKMAGAGTGKIATVLLEKLVEYGIKATMGG